MHLSCCVYRSLRKMRDTHTSHKHQFQSLCAWDCWPIICFLLHLYTNIFSLLKTISVVAKHPVRTPQQTKCKQKNRQQYHGRRAGMWSPASSLRRVWQGAASVGYSWCARHWGTYTFFANPDTAKTVVEHGKIYHRALEIIIILTANSWAGWKVCVFSWSLCWYIYIAPWRVWHGLYTVDIERVHGCRWFVSTHTEQMDKVDVSQLILAFSLVFRMSLEHSS